MHKELDVPVQVVSIQVLLVGLAYDGRLDTIDLKATALPIGFCFRHGLHIAVAAELSVTHSVLIHATLAFFVHLTLIIVYLGVEDGRVDDWILKLHYAGLRRVILATALRANLVDTLISAVLGVKLLVDRVLGSQSMLCIVLILALLHQLTDGVVYAEVVKGFARGVCA